MKKEELKRLKAGLLALSLCFSLGACGKKDKVNRAAVFFVQDKALIYEEKDEAICFSYKSYSIGNNPHIDSKLTSFTPGVEGIRVQSLDDAVELACAIVGEENIIYMDYQDKDMILTYGKGE